MFGVLGHKYNSFLIYQCTAINKILIVMSLRFYTLLKVCIKTKKNSKHHLVDDIAIPNGLGAHV